METFNNPFEKLINIIQLENRQLVELLNLYHSIVPIKMLEMLKDKNPESKMLENVDELSMKSDLYNIRREKNQKMIMNLFDEKK